MYNLLTLAPMAKGGKTVNFELCQFHHTTHITYHDGFLPPGMRELRLIAYLHLFIHKSNVQKNLDNEKI